MGHTLSLLGWAAAAAAALPPGASHWDRMPAELRHMVLEAAGTLTKFAAGVVLPAELQSLSMAQQDELWRDVFECDWQGDLKSLPSPFGLSACFTSVRSRAMLARIRAAGIADAQTLGRVAIRNGWTDELDHAKPERLAEAAAREGAVWLLAELVDVRKTAQVDWMHASMAAMAGHADTVRFVCERMPAKHCGAYLVDCAAANGHVGVAEWLHGRFGAKCSRGAADDAAGNGHVHALGWLEQHMGVQCTADAVAKAARGGRLHVLQHLASTRPHLLRDAGTIDAAAAGRDVRVLKWLHARGMLAASQDSVRALVKDGAAESVEWLCGAFCLPVAQDVLVEACSFNHGALVRWILAQRGIAVSHDSIAAAVRLKSLDALKALILHDSSMLAVIAAHAAETGSSIVGWLGARYPTVGTTTRR
ncbi:hypothetical protein HK105_207371 [Polyrhizophydium stewartii]|uniref:Ankyrin repeat protein n=1 Tax=Polyrhizophydium stewartii TaxID=2732419 RepID=A0ABR4N0S3_9FUNG